MRRLDDKSRMSGGVHVRFRERLRGRFPRATRLVILARYQGGRISDWVEATVEDWMDLSINREKTHIVKLREPGACLDFLGYSIGCFCSSVHYYTGSLPCIG